MKSGNWVSASATASEHGAPACGTAGCADATGGAVSTTAETTAAPTASCLIMAG